LKLKPPAREQEKDCSMLPKDFSFAQLPKDKPLLTLEEVGMLGSSLEDVDSSILDFLKNDLDLSVLTNQGLKKTPVIWISPERAFQIKNDKELRDDSGTLIVPIISVEREGVTKDPARKGSFQAHLFSNRRDGRTGRFVIAKKIVQDKTRDNAVITNTRTNTDSTRQKYKPNQNKRIVIDTLSIPIPTYINIDYKITIRTEYQQHMNDLITPFITRTGQINSFVIKKNGHMYEAFIDQSIATSNNTSSMAEEERAFISTISIKVLAYLIGNGPNSKEPIVERRQNFVDIAFPREKVVGPGDPGFIID
jgi:hypothetical protein